MKKQVHRGDQTLDWTLKGDQTLAANRPDIGLQRSIGYREVPEL